MSTDKTFETTLEARIRRHLSGTLSLGEKNVERFEVSADTDSPEQAPISTSGQHSADLLITGAHLPGREGPHHVAVSGNLIVATGPQEQLDCSQYEGVRRIDARGGSMLPGFVDSHLHLSVALEKERGLDLEGVATLEDMRSRVIAFAADHPRRGLLCAYGLAYQYPPLLPPDEARKVLDSMVPDRALLVYAHDLHTLWANSQALLEADMLRSMPPYPELVEELGLRDKISLGTDELPGGELREPEVYAVLATALEDRHPVTLEERLRDLESACQRLCAYGFTGAHTMGLAQPAEDISLFLLLLELEQTGRLPLRVSTSFSCLADEHMLRDAYRAQLIRTALREARGKATTAADLHDAVLDVLREAGGPRPGDAGNQSTQEIPSSERNRVVRKALATRREQLHRKHVRGHEQRDNPHGPDTPQHLAPHCKVRGDTIKIFLDGVVEKNTAYRLDSPPEPGIPEFDQEELDTLVAFADSLGMQVAAHCIGDASVRSMLDAVERAREHNAELDERRGMRIPHRIEHIEMCAPEDVPRFGRLDVVASMQPLHERPPETLWHRLVPRECWDTAFAWREISERGGRLVFGSDWPIVPCDPCLAIRHATTRTPWTPDCRDQGLELDRAVAAYAANAAATEYSRRIKGSVEPGMLADLVILDGDARDLADASAPLPRVRMTICDGRVTYDAARSDDTP